MKCVRWENKKNNPESELASATTKNYDCFEDYLLGFKSKKRVQIKSERKSVVEGGVEIKYIRLLICFFYCFFFFLRSIIIKAGKT